MGRSRGIRREQSLGGFCAIPAQPDDEYFLENLSELTTEVLHVDQERVRLFPLITPSPKQWHIDRLKAIEAELEARDAS